MNWTAQVGQDYNEFVSFLKQRSFVSGKDVGILTLDLAAAHKICYSFAVWELYLKRIPVQGRAFLAQLRSDSIQFTVSLLLGFEKSSFLLLRSIIEDLLRYIFFYDHPVEYIMFVEKDKFYNLDYLLGYVSDHPIIGSSFKKVKGAEFLQSKYDYYSKMVHSTGAKAMKPIQTLRQLRRDNHNFSKGVSEFRQVANYVNFVLCSFHRKQVDVFHNQVKQFMLRSLSKDLRREYQGI